MNSFWSCFKESSLPIFYLLTSRNIKVWSKWLWDQNSCKHTMEDVSNGLETYFLTKPFFRSSLLGRLMHVRISGQRSLQVCKSDRRENSICIFFYTLLHGGTFTAKSNINLWACVKTKKIIPLTFTCIYEYVCMPGWRMIGFCACLEIRLAKGMIVSRGE